MKIILQLDSTPIPNRVKADADIVIECANDHAWVTKDRFGDTDLSVYANDEA